MKTNTVEQAGRLKELGVKSHDLICAIPVQVGDDEWEQELGMRHSFSVEPEADILGPALTLDDLHGVFEVLPNRYWPRIFQYSEDPFWVIGARTEVASCDEVTFHRTANHASDWTKILIWLLKGGYVESEVVNNYFKNKP